MLETLKSIDASIFLAINGAHSSFFDFIMFWASDRWIWIPLYVFFAWLLFKHYGIKSLFLILMAGLVMVVTDQTSAHDPLHGYVPAGLALEEAATLRRARADEYVRRARTSIW